MTCHEDEDGTRWAALVPELTCADLGKSLALYQDVLGFAVRYGRDGFAYLEREGAQIMLEEEGEGWKTADLERPLGRGINFQIEVSDVHSLYETAKVHGTIFRELEEAWYRDGDIEHGQAEFLMLDCDGYLLRFMQPLGERPAA